MRSMKIDERVLYARRAPRGAAMRAHRVLCEHAIDQRAAVALAAMLVRHEYVAPVRERRMIGDETREADEPGIEIRAEAQRSGDHPFAPVTRNAPRPVRVDAQECVHHVDVQLGLLARKARRRRR